MQGLIPETPDAAPPEVQRRKCVQMVRVIRFALLGAAVGSLVVMGMTFGLGQGLTGMIAAGNRGPAAETLSKDFPNTKFEPTTGHDGQYYYLHARQPMHLDKVAPSMDQARYRMQRVLLPVLAWLLHPSGGGNGLVWALVAIGVASLLLGGIVLGLLSVDGGGSAAVAVAFGLLPGALATLLVGGCDMLALSLALTAILLSNHRRWVWAAAVSIAAVLAREVVFVLLGSWVFGQVLLRHPDRRRLVLVNLVAPIMVWGTWWLYLREAFPREGSMPGLFLPPFVGWWRAWNKGGSSGRGLIGFSMLIYTLLLAFYGFARTSRRSQWFWPMVAQLGFLTILGPWVIGPDLEATRMVAPFILVTILGIVTSPGERAAQRDDLRRSAPVVATCSSH